jgi:hypothetical protein
MLRPGEKSFSAKKSRGHQAAKPNLASALVAVGAPQKSNRKRISNQRPTEVLLTKSGQKDNSKGTNLID